MSADRKKKFLNREECRKIKSMSTDKLEEYLMNIYKSGASEALDEMNNYEIDYEEMRSDIGAINGIGEVRLNQIMEIVTNPKYREKQTSNTDNI